MAQPAGNIPTGNNLRLTAGRLGRVTSLLSSCFTLAGSWESTGDPSGLAFPGRKASGESGN